MANITGTAGNDILTGTADADIITALGGDDKIIGSLGRDTVDGGAGIDTLDFSSVSQDLYLSSTGLNINSQLSRFAETAVFTEILNIEKIIGNPNRSNTIFDNSRYQSNNKFDVDLSVGRLTVYNQDNTSKNYTIENFDNIYARFDRDNRFVGNDRNNIIDVNSNNIIASKGNDTLTSFGTIDYSNLGKALLN
jgi:Ca2+-binding RTX toxin-like protein